MNNKKRVFDVVIDGEQFKVEVSEQGVPYLPDYPEIKLPPRPNTAVKVTHPKANPTERLETTEGQAMLLAPLPGQIAEILVKEGDKVSEGDTLVVLEAMKMYNNLPSPCNGTVAKVPVSPEQLVAKGDILCLIKAD